MHMLTGVFLRVKSDQGKVKEIIWWSSFRTGVEGRDYDILNCICLAVVYRESCVQMVNKCHPKRHDC